jgi:hypothetical protein
LLDEQDGVALSVEGDGAVVICASVDGDVHIC